MRSVLQKSFKINDLFVLTFFWVLFAPKIDLFPISSFFIRFEDLLYLLCVVLFFYQNKNVFIIPKVLRPYILFCSFTFLSCIIASSLLWINFYLGLLFTLRLVQYLSFFFIGGILFRKGYNLEKISKLYIWFSLIYCLLQRAEILPIPRFSMIRLMSSTNGPYEFAILIAFCLILIRPRYSFFSYIVGFGLLLGSASRITILAMFVVIIFNFIANFSLIQSYFLKLRVPSYIFTYSLIPFILICFLFISNNYSNSNKVSSSSDNQVSIIDRFEGLSGQNYFTLINDFYNSVDTEIVKGGRKWDEFTKGDLLSLLPDGVDRSLFTRIYKITYLIKDYNSNNISRIFGLGPSYNDSAVDSYFIRTLIETGLIGFITFIIFLYKLLMYSIKYKNTRIRSMLVVLIATGFFIDIFMASKPMIMFWSIIGYYNSQYLYLKSYEKHNIV